MMSYQHEMKDLLNLPDGILEKILSYLSYDEVARQRIVCHKFDETCRQLLNRGFSNVEKYHGACLKSVKAQLPRRESERRMHPMFRHCEILTAVETRLSMLSMTFMRYVDIKLCCFIPGKVIDEIFRVLRHVMTCNTQLRAHELLQELRDISSMAMEHFDEKVVPRLKQHLQNNTNRNMHTMSLAAASNLGMLSPPVRNLNPEKSRLANVVNDFSKMQSRSKHNKKSVNTLKRTVKNLKLRLKRHGVQLTRQNARLREQSQKLREQDTVIAELKRHMQEWDHILGEFKSGRLDGNEVSSQDTSASNKSTANSDDSSSTTNITADLKPDLKCLSEEESQFEVEIIPAKSKMKRSSSDVSLGSEIGEEEAEVSRVKRFCRILKICENKAVTPEV